MCVILYAQRRAMLKNPMLSMGYDANPHGWGVMWSDGDRVRVIKKVSDFADFLISLRSVPDDAPVAVHFRLATHGIINDDNCHPFPVGNGAHYMHNGIIRLKNLEKLTKLKSDSAIYANNIKQYLKREGFKIKKVLKRIEKETVGSKILIMDRRGMVNMTYPLFWHDVEGVKASNMNFIRRHEHLLDAASFANDYRKSVTKTDKNNSYYSSWV